MKICKHCGKPSKTDTCDECSTSGIGYDDKKKGYEYSRFVGMNAKQDYADKAYKQGQKDLI